jgi:hypothetical protein
LLPKPLLKVEKTIKIDCLRCQRIHGQIEKQKAGTGQKIPKAYWDCCVNIIKESSTGTVSEHCFQKKTRNLSLNPVENAQTVKDHNKSTTSKVIWLVIWIQQFLAKSRKDWFNLILMHLWVGRIQKSSEIR